MYEEGVVGVGRAGHMQFLQRASLLGARCRPSRRTAGFVAAADCVSSRSVSGERRRPRLSPLHLNHTLLIHEAEPAPPLSRSSPPLLENVNLVCRGGVPW